MENPRMFFSAQKTVNGCWKVSRGRVGEGGGGGGVELREWRKAGIDKGQQTFPFETAGKRDKWQQQRRHQQ